MTLFIKIFGSVFIVCILVEITMVLMYQSLLENFLELIFKVSLTYLFIFYNCKIDENATVSHYFSHTSVCLKVPVLLRAHRFFFTYNHKKIQANAKS